MGRNVRTPAARMAKFGKVAALVGIVVVTVTGCSVEEVLRFGWPTGVTPEAEEMRTVWTGAVIAALVVGVLVWGLIFWSVAFHRKKKGDDDLPRQFQYNVPLELLAVAIPSVMVCVLFFFTATTEYRVLKNPENPDVTIDVVAFQWNWEFQHRDAKTPDGESVTTVGSSTEIPILVLPTERSVRFNLVSSDVIHAFWVPDFLFKRDVMPRPEKNNQEKTFTISEIEREGSFVGRCAELCGTYHSVMNFEVRALSPDKYDQYMKLRSSVNPKTKEPYTAAQALSELDCGELCAPYATTTKPFNPDRTARTAAG